MWERYREGQVRRVKKKNFCVKLVGVFVQMH